MFNYNFPYGYKFTCMGSLRIIFLKMTLGEPKNDNYCEICLHSNHENVCLDCVEKYYTLYPDEKMKFDVTSIGFFYRSDGWILKKIVDHIMD